MYFQPNTRMPSLYASLDVLQLEEHFKTCFAPFYKALVIAITIAVTKAKNERSFSCLKRTKTYTCSVMNDVGLGDLVTLYLNRERTSNINFQDIVNALQACRTDGWGSYSTSKLCFLYFSIVVV